MSPECVIGVDLGGTKLLAGVVDGELNVHHRVHRLVHGLGQRELLEAIVEAVEEARGLASAEVTAVGFGIPCMIDQRRGMAMMAVNLPLVDVPFRDLMAERLGLPVEVDNDANVAALAEHRAGAARGTSEAVVLTIGTGIGGGLILNGEPYRGGIGAGAELGHITIDVNGPPCQGNCPNNGCLETLASGTALAREGRRIAAEQPDSGLGRALTDGREITGGLITELAHDGDPAALDALSLIGAQPRRRDRLVPEHLQSRCGRDRRRRDRRGRPAAGSRTRRGGAPSAAADARPRADRAGAVRHRGRARRRGHARLGERAAERRVMVGSVR